MSDANEFSWLTKHDAKTKERPEACGEWAAQLLDAGDGILSGPEQVELDRHVLGCEGCAWELADAQRGAAWLGLLKGHTPEPPANLLSAILEKTSGSAALHTGETITALGLAPGIAVSSPAAWWRAAAVGAPEQAGGAWQRMARWMGVEGGFSSILQPRLAMTSAMAFLSVCLSLNLLGVSVRNLNAESLRPSELQRTMADTGASLVRSFEGIRVVYRVESRVNEWRMATAIQGDSALGLVR